MCVLFEFLLTSWEQILMQGRNYAVVQILFRLIVGNAYIPFPFHNCLADYNNIYRVVTQNNVNSNILHFFLC